VRVNSAEKWLRVTFDNGEAFTLPAELLRVESVMRPYLEAVVGMA